MKYTTLLGVRVHDVCSLLPLRFLPSIITINEVVLSQYWSITMCCYKHMFLLKPKKKKNTIFAANASQSQILWRIDSSIHHYIGTTNMIWLGLCTHYRLLSHRVIFACTRSSRWDFGFCHMRVVSLMKSIYKIGKHNLCTVQYNLNFSLERCVWHEQLIVAWSECLLAGLCECECVCDAYAAFTREKRK